GEYVTYQRRFSIPKGPTLLATGTLLQEATTGDRNVSTWKSEVPQAVAGFNFGKFKRLEAKLEKENFLIQSYANVEPPDFVQAIRRMSEGDTMTGAGSGITGMALGSMSTTSMMEKPLAEARLAMSLYTDYFGPSPYK